MPKKKYEDFMLDNKTPDELKKLSEKVDDRLFGVEENKEITEFVSVGEFLDDAKELVKDWGKLQGLSSGIKAVDYNARGLVGGELTIIAGETSNGKTALGMNIAVNVAREGHPALFMTLEMTHAQLASRVLKTVGSDEEFLKLPLIMQKSDEFGWRDVDRIIAAAKKEGAELVVIDHLHYFTREVDKVAEDLGRITKEFKKNAIRHDIPIALISHVRKKNTKQKQDLTNDALRGSSLIGQDADIVMFVQKVAPDEVVVKVTKNRNRGYDFEKDTTRMRFEDGAKLTDVKEVYNDPFSKEK